MSALSDVMLWAVRVNGRKDAKPHQILDIKPDASLDEAQVAFHKIARIAHPDLHRTTLGPEDLESVTSAYSKAAAAYQEFRTQRPGTRPIGEVPGRPATSPNTAKPAGSTTAASQMSSKALIYYRKAELALRRGDLTSAILQLKMAIAADPQSQFLRSALAEVEAEVAKNP
ncbi:MAG: hypothetical protein M4D80_25345 [Myxococcota bacterium]|nr:hypothetical protein [Deltaproteobacteria bacterium]MDQ3338504.1 hypothetical protein [Myxococcota bacterium]